MPLGRLENTRLVPNMTFIRSVGVEDGVKLPVIRAVRHGCFVLSFCIGTFHGMERMGFLDPKSSVEVIDPGQPSWLLNHGAHGPGAFLLPVYIRNEEA